MTCIEKIGKVCLKGRRISVAEGGIARLSLFLRNRERLICVKEKPMNKKIKLPKWILYCIPVFLLVVLEFTEIYRSADNVVKDILYRETSMVDPRISIIGIDEETLAAYGSIDIWAREKLSDLIDVLMEDPDTAPAIIAIDIGIYSEKNPEIDAKLVESVKNAGNVVFVSAASFGNVVEEQDSNYTASLRPVKLEEPIWELREAALAIGHCNIYLDKDGYARHALGSIEYEGKTIHSFSSEVARCYLGAVDPRFDEPNSTFYIDYSGIPGDYYGALGKGLSFRRVLEGEIPLTEFRDGIVFIGAYASGMQDHYYTNASRTQMMNGVEIQANITAQIMDSRYYAEMSTAFRLTLILVLSLAVILLLLKTEARRSFLFVLPGVAGYILLAVGHYYLARVILPVLSPILAILLPPVIAEIAEVFNVRQERQRLVMNFSRYMPPSVAETVAERATAGQEENAFPGQKKDIAVMFVDIRGFTSISEFMEPEQIAQLINSFLNVATAAVYRQGGTIDKYIGDCMMALFNAPLEQEDYVFKAICAALEIQEKIGEIIVDSEDPARRLELGIGIDCGSAIVGNVGTRYRMDYTAIGNTVNVASRMEGQAGPGEILVSEHVYDSIRDRVNFVHRGKVLLKGKIQPTDMYLVEGIKDTEVKL